MEFNPNDTKAIDLNDPALDILTGEDPDDEIPVVQQPAQQQQSQAGSANGSKFNAAAAVVVVVPPARPGYDGEFNFYDHTPL